MDFSQTLKRIGVGSLVVLVVSASMLTGVGGFTEPAAAEWSEECSFTDSVIGAGYNTVIGADTGCRWLSGDQTDVENLTATNGYSNALGLKDSSDSYVTTTNNFMENTRTVAYSKAKIEVVNELNNGTSASPTKSAVNQTVEDYYSRMQAQIIKDWNAKTTQLDYLNESANIRMYQTWGDRKDGWVGLNTQNITLVNGTTMEANMIIAKNQGMSVSIATVDGNDEAQGFVEVQDPSDDTWTKVLDSTDYGTLGGSYSAGSLSIRGYTQGAELLDQIPQQNDQVVQNMAPYIDEAYAQYQAGELDSTDIAANDPSVIGNEASTSLNSTGYYGHAAIMLASIGATGNINVSHTVDVTDAGGNSTTSFEGTLYYTDSDTPADGWATGQTYNFSDYNGTFYFAAQRDGDATIVDLTKYGDSFTITNATNTKTGESVTTTQVQTYTYDSTNVSALAEEIERLKALRESYKAQETSASGGLSLDGGISGLSGATLGAIAALLAVIVLMRD